MPRFSTFDRRNYRTAAAHAHAANFGFSLAGFSALLLSGLSETPTSYFRDSVQQPNDPIR